ncbi:uncharacterized protein Z519_06340 [Cladophialophora bantiana CBS 173.52]|uniref:Unplaced genomic scaffold supercont1.9, whole genome shotgun sequence n=1 Tax=Cladophialophora bantiana (strain ATCC 10958 / CBS 173.52 / CDC B-1940 / NIH 8579) TaxID=1442370 RepID=A0A0D2HGW3_CLAB1|nr:uncharacterized protein Z519_06340 [Cladophialophora bantiana CBS 173.52]KIW92493.1 hypothetical protein Z519_06340 [Cladophialophora bantiana CBS 173.52]
MAAVSSNSGLLHLEADFLQAQSETVRALSNDIYFAAKILDFKSYDIEGRIVSLRKAALETSSKYGCGGHLRVDDQNKEDGYRVNGVLKNATTLMELARQVKIELKALIEIICEGQEADETNALGQASTEQRNINIESEEIRALKAGLPSLEEELTTEIHYTRRAFADSSGFIPVNFRAVSSKISSEGALESNNICQSQHVQKSRFADEEAMMTSQDSISGLMSNDLPARGRKVSRFSRVGLSGRHAASGKDREHNAEYRSRSPASSRGTGKRGADDLLGWIPKKVCIARLPVDERFRALMMHEIQRKQQDHAY